MLKHYRYILLVVASVCFVIMLGATFGGQSTTEARHTVDISKFQQSTGTPTPYRSDARASNKDGVTKISGPFSPLYGTDVNMATTVPDHKNEFQVDINQTNSQYAIGVSNGVFYYTTNDYGHSWSAKQIPIPPGEQGICCDPGVAYAGNDAPKRAYIVYLVTSAQGGRAYVQRTEDNGQSWSTPSLIQQVDDRPNIVVDRGASSHHLGRVYVTYDYYIDSGLHNQIYGVYSDDKGTTWSTPFPVGTLPPDTAGEASSQPRVASDGTLYVGYQYYSNRLISCSFPGSTDNIRNEVATSTDGGASFTYGGFNILQGGVCVPQGPGRQRAYFCSLNSQSLIQPVIRSASHPILSVNPADPKTVYMVYSGGDLELPYSCGNPIRNGYHSDTLFSSSTDRGATWTAPIKINGDLAGYDQYMPWMDVAPSGKIWVGWHDRREDTINIKSRWYQAYSTDNGYSWTESPVADDTTLAISGIGDYHGLAAKNDLVLGMWYATQFHPYGDPLTDPNPPFHPFQANDEKSKR